MATRFIQSLILSLVLINVVNSRTYYVSVNGSDSNDGLSTTTAFATIQKAADIVASGDSVVVSSGIYEGFDVRTSGKAGHPITFLGLSEDVVIDRPGPIRNDGINVENADYIIIDGFKCINMPGNGNGIRVVLSDHCIVRNCVCTGNAERGIFTGFTDDILIEFNSCSESIDEHGIYVSNSSDRPVIRYNTCFDNNNIGIHMNGDRHAGGEGIIRDAQVYGNVIFENNLAAGINMDGVVGAEVYNNLIYNNHSAQGIALFQIDGAEVTQDVKIYHNTIVVPEDGRWGILLRDGAQEGTEIYNNIIINQHAWRGAITTEDLSGLNSDFNLLSNKMSWEGDGVSNPLSEWQNFGLDLNSHVYSDWNDVFVSPNDFHLFEDSDAVDIGSEDLVNQVVGDDLDGINRPQGLENDLGCYELERITTAINAVDFNIQFSPNPTSGFIHLSHPDATEVVVFKANGQCVARSPVYRQQVDVGTLPSGTYYMKILFKEGMVSKSYQFIIL